MITERITPRVRSFLLFRYHGFGGPAGVAILSAISFGSARTTYALWKGPLEEGERLSPPFRINAMSYVRRWHTSWRRSNSWRLEKNLVGFSVETPVEGAPYSIWGENGGGKTLINQSLNHLRI